MVVGNETDADLLDPMLFAISYGNNRFFVFSKRVPEDLSNEKLLAKRDVLNERVVKKEKVDYEEETKKLPKGAMIETSMGEIHIKLFGAECPKTVENFAGLSEKEFFNNLVFHRVVKGFIIQTGCPRGNGTGGESLWGGNFADEFHLDLNHSEPFMVSMANYGKNTNASQFFITTSSNGHLDFKHTVFGKVVKGMDTVLAINNLKTDSNERPLMDVRIIRIKLFYD